ncbi:c-type cytochrome [Elizabethkingia argentiflava]|uniref:C-type cytochrome n=1 Tax=Elizabethkingia argenteiflava TaxID=2681556 RepID=A0A845PZX0_9FLAO|nr:c-type cytochrome [Elizabethkingia argenteiflava]NAW51908.1 c-type cytochrome [Elizabethkingia argenteiflava]
MKKVVFIAVVAAWMLTSCAKKNTTVESDQKESNVMLEEPKVVSEKKTSPEEGSKLMLASDCFTCHAIDSRVIGPSYQEIATKYTEADLDYLADKIIQGGKGVWGEIPMSPHPGIAKEEAQLIVKYILSLKK